MSLTQSSKSQNHRERLLAAVKRDGQALSYASTKLKSDKEVVLVAVKQSGHALQFASEELKNEKEVVLAAVQQFWGALQYASQALKNDKQVVSAAIKVDRSALKFASDKLKNEKEVVLAAVQRFGGALQYASQALKNDKQVVLAAIKVDRSALKYASETLRNDKDILLASVLNRGWASQKLRKNPAAIVDKTKDPISAKNKIPDTHVYNFASSALVSSYTPLDLGLPKHPIIGPTASTSTTSPSSYSGDSPRLSPYEQKPLFEQWRETVRSELRFSFQKHVSQSQAAINFEFQKHVSQSQAAINFELQKYVSQSQAAINFELEKIKDEFRLVHHHRDEVMHQSELILQVQEQLVQRHQLENQFQQRLQDLELNFETRFQVLQSFLESNFYEQLKPNQEDLLNTTEGTIPKSLTSNNPPSTVISTSESQNSGQSVTRQIQFLNSELQNLKTQFKPLKVEPPWLLGQSFLMYCKHNWTKCEKVELDL